MGRCWVPSWGSLEVCCVLVFTLISLTFLNILDLNGLAFFLKILLLFLVFVFFLRFIYFYVHWCLPECMSVWGFQIPWKELELYTVRCHVGTGNWTLGPLEEQPVQLRSHLSSPSLELFKAEVCQLGEWSDPSLGHHVASEVTLLGIVLGPQIDLIRIPMESVLVVCCFNEIHWHGLLKK